MDPRELEYVSALQQTLSTEGARNDGSIQAVDIQLFLKSRYGVEVTKEAVEEVILRDGFGGVVNKVEDVAMDLCEMTSVLLIPTLVKAVRGRRQQLERTDDALLPTGGLIEQVYQMVLTDLGIKEASSPPELTTSLLCDILITYSEEELSKDQDLLDEMLRAAGAQPSSSEDGSSGDHADSNNEAEKEDVDNTSDKERLLLFTPESFARALTVDVGLYNPDWETRRRRFLVSWIGTREGL